MINNDVVYLVGCQIENNITIVNTAVKSLGNSWAIAYFSLFVFLFTPNLQFILNLQTYLILYTDDDDIGFKISLQIISLENIENI